MEPTHILPPIYEHVSKYLETKLKLLKLEGIDKTSAIIAEAITDLIIVIFSLMAFIIFSLTLAMLAAHLLHSTWEGFCCVTVLYVLIALIIRLFKARLKSSIVRKLIEIIFRKETQIRNPFNNMEQNDKHNDGLMAAITEEQIVRLPSDKPSAS